MLIRITSPDDPRVSAYRDIRDAARARDGAFLVEGEVALRRLAQSRFEPASVFLSEDKAAKLSGVIPGVPIFTAPQDVMDAIAGLPLHRGVLALAKRGAEPSIDDLLAQHPRTLLVLIGVTDHDNIGACFRNAAALGADAVLLDATSSDPLYRKSIRVSSGAALTLPFARGGAAAALLDALERAGFACWALTPSGGETLHSIEPPEKLALLLGAEGPGLPEKLMARCRRIAIPMAAGMDSLNVATAGAIALAHVQARRR